MIDKLIEIENSLLPTLLRENVDTWNSVDVNYHPPRVERLWRQIGENRLFLHVVHPCDEKDALVHRHPWQSAVHVFSCKTYEHGIAMPKGRGHKVLCRQLIQGEIYYDMMDEESMHYVRPIGGPAYTVMLTSPVIWDKNIEDETKERGILHPLDKDRKLHILNIFRSKF